MGNISFYHDTYSSGNSMDIHVLRKNRIDPGMVVDYGYISKYFAGF